MSDTNGRSFNEIRSVIEKAKTMLRHITENSELKVDSQSIHVLLEAESRVNKKDWTEEFEHQFWEAYSKLIDAIHPITIEGLSAFSPKPLAWFPSIKISRFGRFFWSFGVFSLFILILLLATHSYWLIGTSVYQNSQSYFSERESKKSALADLKRESNEAAKNYNNANEKKTSTNEACSLHENTKVVRYSESYNKLKIEIDTIDQKLDESKRMLNRWNLAWVVLLPWDTQMTGVRTEFEAWVYENKHTRLIDKKRELETNIITKNDKTPDKQLVCQLTKKLDKLEKNNELEISRSRNFLRQFSAEYALLTLETFLLPLLYGLLGACVHIMRVLINEVRQMSYTPKDGVCFILRVCLGGLGGLIVGWFLKPDDLSTLGNISGFAIAFLIGYNIETLFMIMDRFLNDSRNLFKNSKNAEN